MWFCSNVHFNVQITELKACSTGKQLKGSDLGTERERGRERAAIVVGDHTRAHTHALPLILLQQQLYYYEIPVQECTIKMLLTGEHHIIVKDNTYMDIRGYVDKLTILTGGLTVRYMYVLTYVRIYNGQIGGVCKYSVICSFDWHVFL